MNDIKKLNVEELRMYIKAILFFLNKEKRVIPVLKLHKYLFYVQFLYKKKYDEILFSGEFKKFEFGVLLENLNEILAIMENIDLIELEKNDFATYAVPLKMIHKKDYSNELYLVCSLVLDKFEMSSSMNIADVICKEPIYKETSLNECFDLELANELISF